MNKLRRCLRYDWPLHFILLFTNWLPDNVVVLRLRGALARPFIGKCGEDFKVGRNVVLYDPANIQIGDHVYLAYGNWIMGSGGVYIEDEVMLGPYCVLASGNHTSVAGSYRFGVPERAPVQIGRGCWIGAHAVLTAGSVIGSGSVIAAGAVVTGDIPGQVVAGGVPARVLKPQDS